MHKAAAQAAELHTKAAEKRIAEVEADLKHSEERCFIFEAEVDRLRNTAREHKKEIKMLEGKVRASQSEVRTIFLSEMSAAWRAEHLKVR